MLLYKLILAVYPMRVCEALVNHRGLGLHTELISHGLVRLLQSGAVTNKYKQINKYKNVYTFAQGDKSVYDFLNDNARMEIYPVNYINNPLIISQNENVVSINAFLEIDFTGQINAETINGKQYSAPGGKEKRKRIKFTKEVEQFIREKLQEEWSPEQISGYAKCRKLFSLSHERIYQFILSDKKKGGQLYKHLRHQHKKYRKRYGSPDRQGPIKNRIMIDDRPKIVEEKKRLGDWEIDTIIGKEHQKAIVTLVERVSKKTLIGQVGSKKADFVSAQIVRLLNEIKPYVLTITADNGSEFAQHEWVSTVLEATIYFAHPYHSWERGLNENTNGLIRQYIPKGKDFTELTDADIIKIQDKLNNRPRKSLGFATPNEVFEKLQKQAS